MNKNFIVPGLFFLFFILEFIFPLRHRDFSRLPRLRDNILLALLGLPLTKFLAYPLVYKIALYTEENHWGLLHQFKLNETLIFVTSFFLLDFCLYWWHRFNHRISFFWRFHQVHHADPDMDASTALRFHFGELILSSLVRITLIVIFGFSLSIILIFDIAVTSCALFHHSSIRLPKKMEEFLEKMIVTPLFHQNHHSYFQQETDSNYSTIFSWWDRLHGTHTPQLLSDLVTIGLPFIGKTRPGLLNLIKMPFEKLKPWPKKFISRVL